MNHLEVALEIAQEASEITLKEVHVVPLREESVKHQG